MEIIMNDKLNTIGQYETEGFDIEVEQLRRLLKDYEADNLRLRQSYDEVDRSNEILKSKVSELIKESAKKSKELGRLKGGNKYDKIVSEGLVKKNGALLHDLTGLKQDVARMTEENIFNRRLNKQLQDKLNMDRAKRLQLLHENELLTHRLSITEHQYKSSEKEAAESSRALVSSEDLVENLDADREAQKDFIVTQFNDIQRLTQEASSLLTDKIRLGEDVSRLTAVVAQLEKENAVVKEERTRLFREVFSLKLVDRRGSTSPEPPIASFVVSPQASPEKQRQPYDGKISKMTTKDSISPIHESSSSLQHTLEPASSKMLSRSSRLKLSSRSAEMLSSARSLYLGSGLGLRHKDEEHFRPKGSAKSLIKKIIKDMEIL